MLQYVKEKPFIDLSPREQSEVLEIVQELCSRVQACCRRRIRGDGRGGC